MTQATVLEYQGDELTLFAKALNWKRYFSGQIAPFLGDNVLEVGAGMGGTTAILAKGQTSWVCLEPDPTLADEVKEAIAAGRLPAFCTVEAGTTSDLLARDRHDGYDSVIYIDVLEHIEDDAGELDNAYRLVRPGGHLVVLSPAFQWLFTPFDSAVGHFRRYDRARMLEIAPQGQAPVKMRYLDSVGMLASLANRLLLRSGMPTQEQVLTWDRLMVPISRLTDPILGYGFGRSILAVWRKQESACES